jgi:hypothetical protein
MKVYIAGKITGFPNYKMHFNMVEEGLKSKGHAVMNPARMTDGFLYEEYMKVCFAMIDVCECVYLMDNWMDSPGARREKEYAESKKKIIFCEG